MGSLSFTFSLRLDRIYYRLLYHNLAVVNTLATPVTTLLVEVFF